MVKQMSWFKTCDNDLHAVTSDSDVCDGTDSDTAHALDFSFKKIDPVTDNDEKTIFNGQINDAGGDGTSHGSCSEMLALDRVCTLDTFLMATCSLHSHNVTIKSPADKFLG